MPSLHRLDSLPAEKMCKLQRQYMQGTQSTFVKRTARQGAGVPLHYHANEQILRAWPARLDGRHGRLLRQQILLRLHKLT
jgi:hypothetical protein